MSLVSQIVALEKEHGELLRQGEAATLLGVTKMRLVQLGAAGIIRRFELGSAVLYPLKDLQAWKERRDSKTFKIGRGHRAEPVFS